MSYMYVGRTVVIGDISSRPMVGYRVSSRSFQDRDAVVEDSLVKVLPRSADDVLNNPYVSYNCIICTEGFCVVANGTHGDYIAEKVRQGYPPKDALGLTLLSLDYEHDDYSTPRIAGLVTPVGEDGTEGYLGIIAEDQLRVKRFSLKDTAIAISTYIETDFKLQRGLVSNPELDRICGEILDLPYDYPVCSAAALWNGSQFDLAACNLTP